MEAYKSILFSLIVYFWRLHNMTIISLAIFLLHSSYIPHIIAMLPNLVKAMTERHKTEQVAASTPSTPLGAIHRYSGHTTGVTLISYMLAEAGIIAIGFVFRSGFPL
jgi:hypothetical protein